MRIHSILLILSLSLGPAIAQPVARPDEAPIHRDTWFAQSAIRQLIFEEYISLNRLKTEMYLESWVSVAPLGSTDAERIKHRKSWIVLAKQGDELLLKWSASAREILKMPNITRDEAELCSKLISSYRSRAQEVRNKCWDMLGGPQAAAEALREP